MRLQLQPDLPLGPSADALVVGGGGVTLLLLARFFPWMKLPPFCTFYNMTGKPCPGCGMTRAWIHMTHGEIGAAVLMNPFGTFLFLCTLGGVLYLALRWFARIPAVRFSMNRLELILFWSGLFLFFLVSWAYTWTAGIV